MIKTENLVKEYNGKRAVDNLNMEVLDGEIFGFLGPNGAGKSTTILMLTGMIEPMSGRCSERMKFRLIQITGQTKPF